MLEKFINFFEIKNLGIKFLWFLGFFFLSFFLQALGSTFNFFIVKMFVAIALIIFTLLIFNSNFYKKSIGAIDTFRYFEFKILHVLISFSLGFGIWYFVFSFLYGINVVKLISLAEVVNLILTSILISFHEEFLCRFVFFTKPFTNNFITFIMIIFSSLIFSFFHRHIEIENLFYQYLIYTFLMGVLFCLIYLYCGTIWVPIAFHTGVNVYAKTIYQNSSKFNEIIPEPFNSLIVLVLFLIFFIFLFRNKIKIYFSSSYI